MQREMRAMVFRQFELQRSTLTFIEFYISVHLNQC